MKLTEKKMGLAILAAVVLAETVWAQYGPSGTAAFRFVNRSGADIHVRASGGFEREFLVDDGAAVLQEVAPGSVTEIAYWPPWSDGYRESRENPCRLTLRAPVAGVTNDVSLALSCRLPSASGLEGSGRESAPSMQPDVTARTVVLRFYNPNETAVSVAAMGGLAESFEVIPRTAVIRSVPAGTETIVRYYAPYSGEYEGTAASPMEKQVLPTAGGTNEVVLVLPPRESAPAPR